MSKTGENEPLKDILDRLRALFGFQTPNKNALPPKAHFSIWYFVIVFFLFYYMQQYMFSSKVETIPYSQFKQALVEDNVMTATTHNHDAFTTRGLVM